MGKEGKDIWFPAKRFGYGWGLPVTWQGWAVLLAYLFLVGVGCFTLADSRGGLLALGISIAVLSIIFIFICMKKGERAAWRWGDKD